MAGPLGRALRIFAGMALILVGVVAVGGTTGWILVAVGAVPLAAGLFNFCLLGPLLGAPFFGNDVIEQGGSGEGISRRTA